MERIDQLNGLKWDSSDIEKKFRHVYVYGGIKQSDGTFNKDIYFIQSVAGSSIAVSSSGPNSAVEVNLSKFFIDEDRPDPCISNNGNQSAFLFCWNPARQWRRGWCPDNTYMFLAPTIGQVPTGPGTAWGWQEAALIYKPNHLHINDALKQFKDDPNVQGRALNNRYWLLRKAAGSPVQLFRRKCFIGSFIGSRFFISSDAKIFNDELERELPVLGKYYA